MDGYDELFKARDEFSIGRLQRLQEKITDALQETSLEKLTIFSGGSYARHEASEYSDIDLFFVYEGDRSETKNPKTSEIQFFGNLIGIAKEMGFPSFSNDCEYLKTLSSNDILAHLGSPVDDHMNLFTVRMLMILESKYLYGRDVYERVLKDIIGAYYRDYPAHQSTFEPWFLLNDIGRFWKTLLLNYENKRLHSRPEDGNQKQKVRNFKLKFSRMTTCFATVAALGSSLRPVTEEQVFDLVSRTPRERLLFVEEQRPSTSEAVGKVLSEYAWFLEHTALTEDRLHKLFEDDDTKTQMFARANAYGDKMYSLLQAIDDDDTGPETRLLRFLVI